MTTTTTTTTTSGLRRMTNQVEHRPAPDVVLVGGGSTGDLSVAALRLVEKLEAFGRGVMRIFAR